jgi:hypothetical protein
MLFKRITYKLEEIVSSEVATKAKEKQAHVTCCQNKLPYKVQSPQQSENQQHKHLFLNNKFIFWLCLPVKVSLQVKNEEEN